MTYPIPMNVLMAARRKAVDAVASTLSPKGKAFAQHLLNEGFADKAEETYVSAINTYGSGIIAELVARLTIYGPLMWDKWRCSEYLAAPLGDVFRMGAAEMRAVGIAKSLTDPGVPIMITTSVMILIWRALESFLASCQKSRVE